MASTKNRKSAAFALLVLAAVIPSVSAGANDWSAGVTYVYDGAGNIRQIGSDYHVYDVVGRLVQSDTNGVRRNYTYDAYGNRKTCTQPDTDCQLAATIDPATNRIYGAGYDAGNLTSFDEHTYSYDAFNMQTREVAGAGSTAVIREYIYTADDERIAVYTPTAGAWRWTLRDGSGKVLRELASRNPTGDGTPGTASWSWVKDYVYRDGLLLATRQLDPATATATTYRYHLDHLGTPRRITDTANRIVGQHTYHAFGPEASEGRIEEPSPTPLKYTGHERDGELDYMHARYYDPRLGRFLSVDPLDGKQRVPQSWNRYAYALNNPLKYTDPTGMYTFAACSGTTEQCQADQSAFEAARQADLQGNDEAVKAAAAAYGDQGVDNGITVGFGNLEPGTAGSVTPQLQGNADGTMGMTASVMFQTGVRGTELRSAVGHEGTHILNAQGFASSFTTNAASWDLTRNLTAYQTETNAFRITHSIYRSANETFSTGCTGCTLGAGVTPADVDLAIRRILANPQGPYRLTPTNQGNRQFPEWTTPP